MNLPEVPTLRIYFKTEKEVTRKAVRAVAALSTFPLRIAKQNRSVRQQDNIKRLPCLPTVGEPHLHRENDPSKLIQPALCN